VRLDDTHPDYLILAVTDNGKGFPTEGRQRLLEPYMTTREGGTGLGLPIVAKILEDHGGGMELADNPAGRGGQVRMWIPKTKQVASEETAVASTGNDTRKASL
jgi:two-component system nitrogen regulation sensor histidine kinase NtrY